MLGRRIELGKVDADTYYVAAEQDHITPWMSCYDSSRLLGGDVRFVLSSSGHIAGIVNPPGGGGSSAPTTRGRPMPRSGSRQRPSQTAAGGTTGRPGCGSARAGAARRRRSGDDEYPALCPAPGTYVLER